MLWDYQILQSSLGASYTHRACFFVKLASCASYLTLTDPSLSFLFLSLASHLHSQFIFLPFSFIMIHSPALLALFHLPLFVFPVFCLLVFAR